MRDRLFSLRQWVAAVMIPLLAAWPATAGLLFVHAHGDHPPHAHPPLVALTSNGVHHHEPHGHRSHHGEHDAARHGGGHSHSHHDDEDHHVADADVVVVAKLTTPALVLPPLLPCGTIATDRMLPGPTIERPSTRIYTVGAQPTGLSRVAGILRAGHALLL